MGRNAKGEQTKFGTFLGVKCYFRDRQDVLALDLRQSELHNLIVPVKASTNKIFLVDSCVDLPKY